ncbi:hypothetical protein A9Q84_15720 [Halobacteriovorax marinus]|uniref:Uncharacterized protein n=1 Tax=Halobacteriovorax marinus TaxID=97084 RepID=A0A1Y5F401_9BACT|nr:hypothetical protein A9Q84_15720 [Halobacteriovorax marinus]
MNSRSNKLFILSLGLLLSSAALSAEVSTLKNSLKKETTDLKINLGIGGGKVDSTLNTASVMGVNIGAEAVHDLSDNLKIKINGGMKVQTGSSSSARDNNIYAPKNTNYLKEALASYTPINYVNIEAGVIDQSYLNAPLLVGRTGFIAAKEALNFKVKDTKITLVATQAIPNNRNLSQKINVQDEGDPRFYAESIILEQELFVGNLNLAATHFAFDDISNAVAYRSILLGNSGSVINNENGKLSNDFQGWHGNLGYAVDINNNHNLAFNGSYLTNSGASENNTGKIIGTTYTYNIKQHSLALGLENFSIGSDASVAYYNSSKYGLANKKGNRVQVEYNNSDQDLRVRAAITQNEVINKNIYQSDETVFTLSLRKIYDLF